MTLAARQQAFRIALLSASTMFLIQGSHWLARQVPAAPKPAQIAVEGRYLPAPGNRFSCPDRDKQGRVYVGYISTQADGSHNPVKTRCVYMTPRAGLI